MAFEWISTKKLKQNMEIQNKLDTSIWIFEIYYCGRNTFFPHLITLLKFADSNKKIWIS